MLLLKIIFIFAGVKTLFTKIITIMSYSPYVKIRVTKIPIKVIVTDKSFNNNILFEHILPCGTNARDLDQLVCCLSRIYPNYNVNAFPITPF